MHSWLLIEQGISIVPSGMGLPVFSVQTLSSAPFGVQVCCYDVYDTF